MRRATVVLIVAVVLLSIPGLMLWSRHQAQMEAEEAAQIAAEQEAAARKAAADESAARERERQWALEAKKLDEEVAKYQEETRQATEAGAEREQRHAQDTAEASPRAAPSRGSDSHRPYKEYVDGLPDHGYVGPVRRMPGTNIRYRDRVCEYCGGTGVSSLPPVSSLRHKTSQRCPMCNGTGIR